MIPLFAGNLEKKVTSKIKKRRERRIDSGFEVIVISVEE